MISRLHGLIFIHVPKCAGMAVEAALGGLPRSQRTEQHFRADDYRRLYPEAWESFHRFAIVRHPVSRSRSFVSFFRRYDPVWRRHLGHVDDETLLRDLLCSGNLLTQRTCDRMLSGAEEVLRFEHLAEDWPRFAKAWSLPAELPRVNSAPAAPSAPLTPGTVLMIEALFARDYDRFGYARSGIDVDALSLADQGAVLWARLRALALDAEAIPSMAFRDALGAWEATIPVPAWRDRWEAACAAHPLPDDSSLDARLLWTERAHDHVNVALGKPTWEPWSTG